MSVGLQNYGNVTAPDSDYPDGRTKDNTGLNDGTPVKLLTLGDYQQFFAKILREAGLVANGLPDNDYTGYQYFDALRTVAKRPGEYIGWDRSTSIIVSGKNSPLVEVFPGSPNLGVFNLEDPTSEEYNLGSVLMINRSSLTVAIGVFGGIGTINGSSSYNLTSGSRVEFVLNRPANMWLIVAAS